MVIKSPEGLISSIQGLSGDDQYDRNEPDNFPAQIVFFFHNLLLLFRFLTINTYLTLKSIEATRDNKDNNRRYS